MSFLSQLDLSIETNNSFICVGLDPLQERLPQTIKSKPKAIFEFNKGIIDATADLVCSYKPQAAYYHAQGAEDQLTLTINYIHQYYPHIPVILDAKRGDIGSTADQYAKEAFERYQADAVTVNPYMGVDSIESFTRYKNKGVIVLCRTSNPGADAIQNLIVGDRYLYEVIAEKAINEWNENGNILLVVGATNPKELRRIRKASGDTTLLVPGIGAQGGDIEAIVKGGLNNLNKGIIISSSRSIIYASNGSDFQNAARRATIHLRDTVNIYR
ncbi:MAG: orotidine-5'-phosphate decarboxylase [Candidatus Endonucleobacter bathymodioli]|uniref:Orotidine 5'-phosphate decarboxylase n=1 Tax=Candidatus Endonucleibacter bathymodioli TaxID=539814 RepID=A0AA90NYY2_9GAMM|nr:orotidine-5'-phosphate decarboxylase [Candidatus Endonucleobacter bathymodioli]